MTSISSCCGADVAVKGNTTKYHVCQSCLQACDVVDEVFDSITADVKSHNPDWFDKYGHWSDWGYRTYFPDDIKKILQDNTKRIIEKLQALKRPTRDLESTYRNHAIDDAIQIVNDCL